MDFFIIGCDINYRVKCNNIVNVFHVSNLITYFLSATIILKEIIILAELKTKQNNASVEKFLTAVPDSKKRNDSFTVLELMKKITKEEPKMWGTSIIGFGSYH